jgi:phytoene desaturase
MNSPRIIIIGAGIGGITAAIHLAQHNFQVTVYERNDQPGGRVDYVRREGHTFDTGPTLLVMPLLYEREFTHLGLSFFDDLDLMRVDPTYHLIFDDGSQLEMTSDLKTLEAQLERIEPGSGKGLMRYLEEGYRHYHKGVPGFVDQDFKNIFDFIHPRNIPLIFQVKPFTKHYQNLRNYFQNPRLKAAFSFQDVYMGLSPFDGPATFSLMPYSELAHGVFYPKGGMYTIVEVLMDQARKVGVEFIFDEEVQEIHTTGNRATGITSVEFQNVEADYILANADLPYVFQELLPDPHRAQRIMNKRFSCSTFSFFWGIDKVFPEIEGPHTLFLADDYKENFESIIDELTLPENPCVYIHAPTRLDPSLAPEGQDTIIGIAPVGHMSGNDDQDWVTLRDQARQAIFRRLKLLGISDFIDHIKFETNFTPLSWKARYNLAKGSTHGLCHNLFQLGGFRPDFQHPLYKNLFFTGASTRPGTGLPTAMVSGRMAATRICEDFGIDFRPVR